MALSLRGTAGTGGQQGATTATSQAITLPTDTAAGDLVYFVISVGAVVSAPAATGWTVVLTSLGATPAGSSIVGYRTIQSGDTGPTVTWTTAGKVAWTAIALAPASGQVAAHSGFATVLNGTTTATSRTPNSYAAGALTGASVILNAHRESGNTATGVTTTPPTNWTEPTNGDQTTAVGTTSATRQVAAEVSYQLAQTGTIAPGTETVSLTSYSVVTHAFAVEQAPPPKMSTLTDEFTTKDTTLWFWGSTAAVSGGQLSLPENASYTSSISTAAQYDLTGSYLMWQIAGLPAAGAGTTESYGFAYIDAIGTNSVGFEVTAAPLTLQALRRVGGTSTTVNSATYSATNHKYVRIREASGTIYWDTSPDGTTWNNLTSWVNTLTITSLYALFGSGYYGAETSPTPFLVENVNVVPSGGATVTGTATLAGAGGLSSTGATTKAATATLAGAGGLTSTGATTKAATATLAGAGGLSSTGALPVSSLVSDFSSGMPAFFNHNTGSPTVSGGVASLPVTSAFTLLLTDTAYNAVGSSTSVKITPQYPIAANTYGSDLWWGVDANNAVVIFQSGTQIRGQVVKAGVTSNATFSTSTYNPVAHAYWRLRESGGTVYFDVAPDGVTWTNLGSLVHGLNLGLVGLQIDSGYTGTEATPSPTLVDNLNVTPTVQTATATLAGAGGLSSSATRTQPATSTLAGAGALASSGVVTKAATATFAGAGALASSGVVTKAATATLAGAGALGSGSGGFGTSPFGTAPFGGVFGVTATVTPAGGTTQAATATLAGAGSLAATATRTQPATATLAGAGGLTASATRTQPAAATLAGAGALTTAATRTQSATATFGGAGGLTATTATAATYYVDQTGGSNSNDGLSTGAAWATIAKVNSTTFAAGSTVLFKRGQTWSAAALSIGSSGTSAARITVGAYGTGAVPIFSGSTSWPIAVTGNYVTVQDVQAQNAGGDKVGIGVTGTDCLLQRVTATGNAIGVQAYNGAHRLRVTASNLSNNTTEIDPDGRGSAQGSTDDYGCNGVVILQADNCEIDNNTISGNVGVSPDFGYDGSAVEVYGSIGTVVHHNVCDNNQTFTELGDSRTSGTEYYDNLITANLSYTTPIGLNAQGTGTFGPVLLTKFYNNTIALTGTSQGIVTGTGATAAVHNNIVVASYLGYTGGQKIDEGNNVYFGGADGNDIWSTANASTNAIAPTSTIANPLFIGSGNYRLQATSPAVGRGTTVAYTTDLDGNPRTVGAAVDAGAYELQPTVVSATATLAGAGGLSSSAIRVQPATATLAGSGALASSGAYTAVATASLAGAGSLSSGGVVTQSATATLAGAGGLTATGAYTAVATATLTGAGGLSSTGVITQLAAATFSGAGGLNSSGVATQAATASLAGAGALSSAGTITKVADAALNGAGGLSSTAVLTQAATATFAGIGGLSSSGVVTQLTTATFAGAGGLSSSAVLTQVTAASFVGAGGLSSSGVVTQLMAATLAGAGGLTATGVVTQSAAAALAGAGGLTAAGTVTQFATASLAGAGGLSSSGVVTQFATASFTGAGGLTATGAYTAVSTVTLTGAGGFTAAGVRQQFTAATFAGAGGMTADTLGNVSASAVLSSAGSLTATSVITQFASVVLAGAGGIAAAGVVTQFATAAFAGAGGLGSTGVVTRFAAATLAGAGGLSAAGTVATTTTATFTGAGLLSSSAVATGVGSAIATLNGAGALSSSGARTATATAALAGAGSLSNASTVTQFATVSLNGAGGLAVSGAYTAVSATTFAGAGGLTVTGVVTGVESATAMLVGAGGLTVAATRTAVASLTFTGAGALAVASTRTTTATATLAGSGALAIASGPAVTATFTGAGGLAAAAILTQAISATLAGDGALTPAGVITRLASVVLTGEGGLSADSYAQRYATVSLTGVGVLLAGSVATLHGAATFAGAGGLVAVAVHHVGSISWVYARPRLPSGITATRSTSGITATRTPSRALLVQRQLERS